jgi:hypothetical protein
MEAADPSHYWSHIHTKKASHRPQNMAIFTLSAIRSSNLQLFCGSAFLTLKQERVEGWKFLLWKERVKHEVLKMWRREVAKNIIHLDVYFIFQMVAVASIRGSTFLRNVGVKLRTYRIQKFWGLSPQQHTSWNAENLHLLYPATRASLTSRNILISFSYQRQKNTRDLNYRNGRNCKWQPSVLSVISFVMATVVLATLCLSRGARQPVDRQSRPVRLFVLFIRIHNRWK